MDENKSSSDEFFHLQPGNDLKSENQTEAETEKLSEPAVTFQIEHTTKPTSVKEILFFIVDICLNVMVIVLLVYLIRSYLIAPFRVYGSSMCNTLNYFEVDGKMKCIRNDGEYIIVNKFGYQHFFNYEVGQPKRGDIVVFLPPNGVTDYYIKRIIGLPGEKVEIRQEGDNGYVYIYNDKYPDGFKLDEPYLSSENAGKTFLPRRTQRLFEVTADHYFVLGDNRQESSDSRHCFTALGCVGENTPFLSRESLDGKAWLVLWPFKYMRVLSSQ